MKYRSLRVKFEMYLGLRQYKNDSMDWKNVCFEIAALSTRLFGGRKHAANSNQTNIFSQFESFLCCVSSSWFRTVDHRRLFLNTWSIFNYFLQCSVDMRIVNQIKRQQNQFKDSREKRSRLKVVGDLSSRCLNEMWWWQSPTLYFLKLQIQPK